NDDAGIVDEDVEAIGRARKVFGCAMDALGLGNVYLEKGDVTIGAESSRGRAAGFGISRAEVDVKFQACELARDFESDPFICAGNECNPGVFHAAISSALSYSQLSAGEDFGMRMAMAETQSRLAGGAALPETAHVSQSVVKVDPEIMSG